jgi:hypothetical protein
MEWGTCGKRGNGWGRWIRDEKRERMGKGMEIEMFERVHGDVLMRFSRRCQNARC